MIDESKMLQPRSPSRKRFTHLGATACILFLCFPFLLRAQIPLPASNPAPVPAVVQPAVPQDALGRTTPRGTVLGFLNAARKGDDDLASQYLNTRHHDKAAANLANQLYVVLDRRLPARLNVINDAPDGSDPLRPTRELVGTIGSDNGSVDILLERVDRGKSGSFWLFSSQTLDSIPNLYQEINVVSVDNILPEFLVNTRFAGIVLFEWLAVFVGMPLFYFLTVLLSHLLGRSIGSLRRRLYRKPELPNPLVLPTPIRILLLALVIRWLLAKLSLPLLARQFWMTASSVITIAGCVWLAILLNGRVEQYIRRRLRGRNLTGATSILRLARRAVDGLIVFTGMLVALYHFGVNPTAGLAGLGVGGIAVALAAQKTLENVIGGVSLIFDQAVGVGDTLKVADTLGTVEDIGLRSTRIRTLDRTMVSVPNGQIANMTLENLSSRDKFWFHPVLPLSYGTTSAQMCSVLDKVRNVLKESRQVETAAFPVRFVRWGPSSLDLEVFAYILARNWDEFLQIQERLFLKVLECVEASGVQFAFPLQTVAATGPPAQRVERASLNVPALGTDPGDKDTLVKSA